jgi:hypothetical protein
MMKFLRALHPAVFVIGTSLVAFGCSAASPSGTNDVATMKAVAAGPVGTIRGVVRLTGKAPSNANEKIAQDQATCGDSVPLPRIVLGKSKGIKDTFVFLDGVPSDPGTPQLPPASILVDQKRCQYEPHAMTVPVGTELEITNSDPILHNVHGNIVGSEGLQTLFNIAQPIQGQHGKTPAMDKPGIVFLTCEAGHPWMNAYIFVASNPYVAVTKDDGDFVIANVPVGTYHIKMWHEGVTLKQNNKTMQRYDYEDPYETTKEVVVKANGEAVVDFDLTLRPNK